MRATTKRRVQDAKWDLGVNLLAALIIYIAAAVVGYVDFNWRFIGAVVLIGFIIVWGAIVYMTMIVGTLRWFIRIAEKRPALGLFILVMFFVLVYLFDYYFGLPTVTRR